MKKRGLSLKFDVLLNIECLIDSVFHFLKENNNIEPSVILLCYRDKKRIRQQQSKLLNPIVPGETEYFHENKIVLQGIIVKLEIVDRLSEGEIEIH